VSSHTNFGVRDLLSNLLLELNFDSIPVQPKETTKHDQTGNWQIVLLNDGTECEGLVFESVGDAEETALQIGCSGYHEHHQQDGSVLYMPCSLDITDPERVKADILDALEKGEITQEEADAKLSWLIINILE
jgi:hypothetical protein